MANPKDMRDRLIRRFYTKFTPEAYDQEQGTMPDLIANDQHPDVLFISCIDSRVAPGVIFKMNPGEALTHRHIAGLVPPYDPNWENGATLPGVAAAIEFAVEGKEVSTIIIKGHTLCGGVKAFVEGTASPLVKAWMDNAGPALNHIDPGLSREETLREAEREIIRYSFRNLITYPCVRKAMMEGKLNVEAWIHDIEKGALLRLDPATDEFVEMQADGSDITEAVKNGPGHNCSHG